MCKYYEVKKRFWDTNHPEIFYAFSKDQFEEGAAKMPKGKEIYRGHAGQFGTKDGFDSFRKSLDTMEASIKAECTPEEVYQYEFDNHECGYTGDDSEAVAIVQSYWPDWTPLREVG